MELLFSILASTIILMVFKSFPKWNINTFQAVVSNYFTAFICGFLLFKSTVNGALILQTLPIAMACGTLFISLFVIMGLSAQNNGVSTTSVAVKMSMALSVILVMGLAREWTGISHIAALCLAILGVFFVSRQTEASGVPRKTWMLLVLFFGSSALDVVLFTIHRFFMPKGMNDGFFSSLGFLMAGLLGLTFFILQWKRNKIEFDGKSWIAGIVLGIPNYFSIYLLMASYTSVDLPASKILAIANLGVVILSTALGKFVFKENFTIKRYLGFSFCLLSLLLLLFF